ncbi:Transcriptional regulator, LysR family (plasmid) [Cupriavidus necator H850]|uniref:LysR substrate-binding domain-containing protein n=1 Tax=Cupriavidus necator TaxID=106590 RepID=UPI0020BD795D|nr:LysR substrate-binding domain-containing protein [Cupriavidus necator]KAI3606015.1 Transcriptional regulator, LysR family [Cupriavidus necator H850]
MKDHHLKAWLSLVETGSIRGAARSLHLSQAAITKAIRELEQDLDAPLIVRSSRGVTLTECGHQLTMRVRLAQAQFELARQDIRQLQGGKEAHVSVAVTPTIYVSLLPDVIDAFRKRMPLAELNLEEGMMPLVLPALRDGSIDFAVAAPVHQALAPEFSFEPLQTLEMIVGCRPGHPLAKATEWEQLLDCEWLMHLAPGSHHTDMVGQLQRAGIPVPQRIITTNSFGVTWNLMTRSDALLSCPAAWLSVQPYAQQVTRVPLRMPLPSITLGILSLRDTPLSLAAETMAELFRREIAAHGKKLATGG